MQGEVKKSVEFRGGGGLCLCQHLLSQPLTLPTKTTQCCQTPLTPNATTNHSQPPQMPTIVGGW